VAGNALIAESVSLDRGPQRRVHAVGVKGLRVPDAGLPSRASIGYAGKVLHISTVELFNGLERWMDTLPLNPGMTPYPKITITLSLQEQKLFQRALARAAQEGLLKRAVAMRRIGELEVLGWQAEEAEELSRRQRAKISEATRAGLERQRLTKKPGPAGHLGPGRPPVKFDRKKARAMRARPRPASYAQIAEACGVSKPTIARFFGKKKPPQTAP